MNDLISRDDVYDVLKKVNIREMPIYVFDKLWNGIRDLPSIEPKERTVEVIEHEMIITDADGCSYHRTKYICGNCKEKVLGGDEYCSHCGTRLEWDE